MARDDGSVELNLTMLNTTAIKNVVKLVNPWQSFLRGLHLSAVQRKSAQISLVLNDKIRDGVDHQKTGVTFLFGWTGSSFKHLQKYSEYYEKKGESVVRYCPSPFFIYKPHPRKEYKQMSLDLLKLLRDNGLEKRPIFFHTFSNGGTYMYYALCQELVKKGIAMRGTVLDSTPGKSGYYLIKGSVAQVSPGNSLIKNTIAVSVYTYCEIFLRYKFLLDSLLMKDTAKTEDYRYFLHRSMVAQPNLGPQLCLFSKTDDVTYYRDVQLFIQERKKLGVDIEGKLWDESRHVKHLLDHPDDYVSMLDGFFEKCRDQKHYVEAPAVIPSEDVLCRSKL